MKKKYLVYMTAIIIGLSSCVKDEGTNTISPINEVTITGIEKEYNKVSSAETLVISPTIETSFKIDEKQLEYKWVLCTGGASEEHTIIGTEKNLDFLLNIPPGNYYLYFQVLDKTNGLKWENACKLNTITPFVRGFYLFGDKEDGTCGVDFVSMMAGRDTTVVENIFINSLGLKGAQNLIFTGEYRESTALWAVTESGSHSIEYSSSLSEYDIRKEISIDKLVFPIIPVTRPLKLTNIYPRTFSSKNTSLSRSSRIIMTENELFAASIIMEEAFGNPSNRYSTKEEILFKPSQYFFYQANKASVSRAVVYDMTNETFASLNSLSAASCTKFTTDTSEPFYFDQTKYNPTRTLVYGENGFGNDGRSYALMTDASGKYYVYGFTALGTTSTKHFARNIDLAVAQQFAQASFYTFFSMQPIILYAIGSQLWAYDYTRNDAKMVKDFGSEITYLIMDYNSNDTPTDFIVATYSPSEKGIVRKFTIVDDQNKIEITPHEREVWKTDLKVVKVEYRNSTL